MKRLYFDICATTPVDQRVSSFMHKLQNETYGNPSSIHREGQAAKAIIEKARIQLSNAINCSSDEIIFTSSGSESNNLLLKGILNQNDHFITSSYEHPAILAVIPYLKEKGVEVSIIDPNKNGIIQPDSIRKKIKKNTKLVSIMFVNNEIGTTNPINEISKICYQNNIFFHSDAVQALGKVPIDLNKLHIDFLSISAHKIYGPKGVGALFKRKGKLLKPLIYGGGQEFNQRASTENIAGIGGFGLAAKIASTNLLSSSKHLNKLEKYFINELKKKNINFKINGTNRAPGIINITFPKINGNNFIMNLDLSGIAISFGAACSSGAIKDSSILSKLGLTKKESLSTVRISFGKIHKTEDVKILANKINEILYSQSNKLTLYE